jgi:hypothetical protein
MKLLVLLVCASVHAFLIPPACRVSRLSTLYATQPLPPRKIQKQLSKLPDLSQSEFPIAPIDGYDLIVIGSGPGGEAAAAYAARLGKKVAIIG